MTLLGWPFLAYTNKLLVVIKSQPESPGGTDCATTNLATDDSGNVRWVQIELNGVILYPIITGRPSRGYL